MSITLAKFKYLRAACLAAVVIIGGCSEGNDNGAIEGPFLPPLEPTSADYELVWSDEFDGAELDSANWDVQTGNGAEEGIPGWGNAELQYYTEDNITVSGGNLVIEAREGDSPDSEFDYTSGRIRSEGKVDFTFGRIEASIQVPPGVGIWAAFWTLGAEPSPYGVWAGKGEIDILESFGGDTPFAQGALHFGMQSPENVVVFKQNLAVDPTDGFHQYVVEWDVEQIRWYIDGEHYFTMRADSYWNYYYASRELGFVEGGSAAPFDQDQYLLLNLAIGGNLPGEGPNPATVFPAQMLVDYVRLYQCPIDPENTGLGCQNSIDPVNPFIIAEFEEAEALTAAYSLYLDGTETLFEGTGADRNLDIEVFDNEGALMLTEVATPEGGMALDALSTGGGNFSIKDSAAGTFDLFGMGSADESGTFGGEIKFDIQVISGADTDPDGMLLVKMDSGFPDVGFVEIALSSLPQDEWTTVSVRISDILQGNQGFYGGEPADIANIVSLVTFEPSSAAHFQINNIELKCGGRFACGIISFATEPFEVFIDSVNEVWERGIRGFDTVVGGDYPEAQSTNHVTWELVDTGEEGHDIVIETSFSNSGASGLTFIGAADGGFLDLSAYSQGELVFDARYISNPNDLPLIFKVDGVDGAGTGEQPLGQLVLNEWTTFQIPVQTLINQGLPLDEVTAFVLLPTFAGNDAVLQWDNVRFEPTTSGNAELVGLPVGFEKENAFYNFINFEGGASTVLANPEPGGINTSATVVRMQKFGGPPGTFGGSTFKLDIPIDFTASEKISVSVWASREVDVTMKLEGADAEAIVRHGGTGWEQLVFDYTGRTLPGEMDLTFIFDNGTAGDAQTFPDDWTFYYDDIVLQTTGGTGGEGATGCDACTDFDDPGTVYSFIDFGTPPTPMTMLAIDPLDAANMVASTSKPLGAAADAGTTLDSGVIVYPLSSTDSKITVRIYAPAAGLPVRLKLANSSDPMRSVEAEVMTITAGSWETLVFDFNNPVAGTPALDPGTTYDQLSIFFNYGVDGNTGGELTFLWDTIEFLGDATQPSGFRYSTDFESSDPTASVIGDGWTFFVNVPDAVAPDAPYGYGGDAPNGTGFITEIATGEGDIEQGLQYLNFFSDYNNQDHNKGYTINALTFQERTIGADDGGNYRFTFQAKAPAMGGIAPPTTAQAFIKTLDPLNNFATTSEMTVEMSAVSNLEWTTYTVELSIDGVALEGQLLQFGFENSVTMFNPSGIFYDNIDFRAIEPTVGFDYESDFEASNPAAPTIGDGWTFFVNVPDAVSPDAPYGYGGEAPNGTGFITEIATGEGDMEQGLQYLNCFSDYNNADHAKGYTINGLTFQERTIASGNGGNYRFTFDAKAPFMGGIGLSSTAQAFIKTLDPLNNFVTTSEVTVDMTAIDNVEWATFSIELSIDASALQGQLLQFGFENTATNYEPTGIFYDNVSFGLTP